MPLATFSLRSLQALLDRVRRLIDPSAVVAQDQIVEAYQEFDEVIRETNERLQECDGLLREGHRSQALKLSEQDPDLFRVMELLEFPELPLWLHLISEAGLVQPVTLLTDIASDLNEAYNLERPLTDLMRMHRLHALAGSPLKTRLEFLRKIAQRDPNNPIWPEDVRNYERARHLQIEQELRTAEKNASASQASHLEREVRGGGWLEPPPASLVEEAVRIHTHLRQSRARAQIKQLADQLHEACAARDEDQAIQLRTAWNGQVTLAQLPSSDAVFELVEPVFDWLDREEERRQRERDHAAAVMGLSDALDNNVNRAELEKRFNLVTRYGAPPPELARKVEIRVQVLEQRKRMYVWSSVIVALACLGLFAVGVTWAIGYWTNRQELAKQAAAFAQLVSEQKLTEATEFHRAIQQKSPKFAASPEVQKIAADLAVLQAKEQERSLALEAALGNIRGAIEENDWNRLELAQQDVTAAEKLATSSVESQELQNLQSQLRAGIRKHQTDKDQAFVDELRELAQAVSELGPADVATIDQLKIQAERMQNQARVSSELKSQVGLFITKLEGMRSSDDLRRREAAALQQVREAAGNLGQYTTALEAYAQQFPTTARAKFFTNVVEKELPLLPLVDGWNQIINAWSTADFRRINPVRSKEMLDQLEKAKTELGEHPATAELMALQPYLEAVVGRVDESGGRIHKELSRLLSDPRISQVDMLLTKDGSRYYFDQAPRPNAIRPDTMFDFRYFPDASLKDPKLLSMMIANIVNGRRDGREPPLPDSFIWTSPQKRFREPALKLLTALSDENWERQFLEMLRLLDAEKEMEPTLRLYLMTIVLQTGCQGSHCLQQGFQQSLEIMDMNPADVEANWFDPTDDLAKKARNLATDALEQLQPYPESRKVAGEHYLKLDARRRGVTAEWSGILLKEADGKFGVQLFAKNPPEGATLVIAGKSENGALKFTPIGTVVSGKAQLSAEALPQFAEGRPVLISKN